jgi:cytochrome c biogenesis protein
MRRFRLRIASMETAVVLLAIVAGLAVLGVVIGQDLPAAAYVERYGHAFGVFLVRAGLASIYSSWYFLAAVAALAVSILACSSSRIARLLRASGGPRLPKLGSLLTHLSIVAILAGGVVTAALGFREPAARYLAAGDEIDVPTGGFALRVDSARTDLTEDGRVADYVSVVTVLEGGRETGPYRIEVNRPLVHDGLGVYQYEMLPAADSVDSVLLSVSVPRAGGEEESFEVVVPFHGEAAVPGTDITLKVLEFLADFTYDVERRTAELASVRHENPAVLVQVAAAGGVVGEQWVFANFGGHAGDLGLPCRLLLLDYRPDYARGLTRFEFSRQPGTPVIFSGFGALSVGLCLLFWTRLPRRESMSA